MSAPQNATYSSNERAVGGMLSYMVDEADLLHIAVVDLNSSIREGKAREAQTSATAALRSLAELLGKLSAAAGLEAAEHGVRQHQAEATATALGGASFSMADFHTNVATLGKFQRGETGA